jgi:plastocyanin
MKTPLKKNLFARILGVCVVALAVVAAGAPATVAAGTSSFGDAQVSGLTKKQKKKKKKELKKCNKKKNKKKKKKCKKQVNKKYKKKAKQNNTPKGKTYGVVLGDNYYVPNTVDLKVNDSINWKWTDVGGFEPHNVTLVSGPSGVSRSDFASQTTADPAYTFKRTFTKPGTYNFQCSLHIQMTMTVKASK